MNEEEIFAGAIEIVDPSQRRAFLEDACGDNASLRSSVDELLSMHDTAGDFLETPALETSEAVAAERAGTVIGRYKLIQKIGEGGFGDVWKAEQQQPVRRVVALKVIKPGMDTRRVIARFEAERQVLAIMNHRNIAAVLDAGSTQRGRPYFVMELVDGLPIDDFCDQECMPIRERLRLLARICCAVQHAHQKGIVHRDLKPSNILVSAGDSGPDARIIDFGIAKAMQNPVTFGISATSPQQLMGTPEYMSPEQLTGEADIDTRADVYALGGVLYKLLVGVAPLDIAALRSRGFDALSRAIREDDAPRPSTRILRLDDAPQIAALRDSQPATLSRSLRGDVDAIVSKALSKERAYRYDSASDLARDIDRFLSCEPVSATPPTALYRTKKLLRRNGLLVLVTSVVLIALILGSVGLVSADRARRNEAGLRDQARLKGRIADYQRQAAAVQLKFARAKADEALRTAELLEGIIGGASPREGKRVNRRQLDDFAHSLGEELNEFPEIEARLRRTIGRAYLDLIEISLAGTNLERALKLRLELHAADHKFVLESRVDYATFLIADSRMDEAEQEVNEALPALRTGGPSAALVDALRCLSRVRRLQEQFLGAEKFSTEAWALAEKVYGSQAVTTLEHQCEAGYGAFLAGRYPEDKHRLLKAENLIRDALKKLNTHWPGRRFEINSAKVQLARLLIDRGEFADAKQLVEAVIAERRDALGNDSKYRVTDLLVMSRIHMGEKDFVAAEKVAREALAMAERVNDERERIRGLVYYRLSRVARPDRPKESVEWHRKAIDAWHNCLGNHLTVALHRRRLAEQLRSLGRYSEAEHCLLQSMQVLNAYPERTQPKGTTHHRIADLLRTAGEEKRALRHLRTAISLHDPNTIFSAVARLDCIDTLIELGELEEAEQESQAWFTACKTVETEIFRISPALSQAQLLIASEKYADAETMLHDTYGRIGPDEPRVRARVQGLLAKCFTKTGDFESAERILLAQAQDKETAMHPLEPRRVARQLVALYDAWNKPKQADRWRERRAN